MLIKKIKNKRITVTTKENLTIEGDVTKIDKQSNILLKNVKIREDVLPQISIKGSDICYIIY
ncbi:hypothetical protein AAJ76_500075011 [Vairimorpha ceranae]|uniref:Sm domain-containing protein n=1 Tax=Vairimorpha ceranae TaxID=40302 RepID=A0A0F9ZFV9_9MICR|nr:hypothetical protein AAJ76_500075011 [Vairimorpha ceranae]KKO76249.1 hypothetical protein AAJ76_500075011 [Vairimorpha ceranae]